MKRLTIIVAILALGIALVWAADEAVKAPAGMAKLHGAPAVAEFPAMKVASVMEKAADFVPEGGYAKGPDGMGQAYGKMMENGFGKLGKWMSDSKVQPVGPCLAIYYEDPMVTETAKLTTKVAFPVSGEVVAAEGITIEEIPAMPMAISLTFEGPYDNAMNAWDAVMKYGPEHGLEWAGPAMEVYLKGPMDTQNPQEYVTEIRVPVKKAEMKEANPK
jgi:effector-binding domain-containing protein